MGKTETRNPTNQTESRVGRVQFAQEIELLVVLMFSVWTNLRQRSRRSLGLNSLWHFGVLMVLLSLTKMSQRSCHLGEKCCELNPCCWLLVWCELLRIVIIPIKWQTCNLNYTLLQYSSCQKYNISVWSFLLEPMHWICLQTVPTNHKPSLLMLLKVKLFRRMSCSCATPAEFKLH